MSSNWRWRMNTSSFSDPAKIWQHSTHKSNASHDKTSNNSVRLWGNFTAMCLIRITDHLTPTYSKICFPCTRITKWRADKKNTLIWLLVMWKLEPLIPVRKYQVSRATVCLTLFTCHLFEQKVSFMTHTYLLDGPKRTEAWRRLENLDVCIQLSVIIGKRWTIFVQYQIPLMHPWTILSGHDSDSSYFYPFSFLYKSLVWKLKHMIFLLIFTRSQGCHRPNQNKNLN